MVDNETKQMYDKLKGTKRRFRIEAGNYGGEVALGLVSPAFAEWCKDKDESDIMEAVQAFEWDEDPDTDCPKPTEHYNAWYEVDDFEHVNGAYSDGNWTVTEVPADGSDDMSWENQTDIESPYHLYGREAYHDEGWSPEEDTENADDYVPVMCWHSGEKGGFGVWFVDLVGEDFDPKKLAFSSVETNCAEIVETVWYDKQELEANYDWADTTGKGYYVSVGYMNTKWHDQPKTEEQLEEYWEYFDDDQE